MGITKLAAVIREAVNLPGQCCREGVGGVVGLWGFTRRFLLRGFTEAAHRTRLGVRRAPGWPAVIYVTAIYLVSRLVSSSLSVELVSLVPAVRKQCFVLQIRLTSPPLDRLRDAVSLTSRSMAVALSSAIRLPLRSPFVPSSTFFFRGTSASLLTSLRHHRHRGSMLSAIPPGHSQAVPCSLGSCPLSQALSI
ncbi:hypothetical protein NDU88_004945 [Pleurodeles waltl]|uniref:Uncharacterized protein n=1 Tax=Pleurodeles waltl TaxID=8319 RepID=A0AAV7T991_PLEWA|nr:hypothetical protein NDU88_004945 [Pleurodeles waltl]